MSEQLKLPMLVGDEFSPQTMVEQFHWATGSAVDDRSFDVLSLRRSLLEEEYRELRQEIFTAHRHVALNEEIPNHVLAQIAKESADLLYVVFGAAVSLGIDLEEAFRRVHESNMSKLVDGKAVLREDGKVLKGPDYRSPDLTGTYRESEDA